MTSCHHIYIGGQEFFTGGNMKLFRVILPLIGALAMHDAFAQSSFPGNLNRLCTSQVPPLGAPNLSCNDCHVANRATPTNLPGYIAYLPSGTTAQKLALCLPATATPTPMATPTPTPVPNTTPTPRVTPTPGITPTPRSRPPRRSRRSNSPDDDSESDDD